MDEIKDQFTQKKSAEEKKKRIIISWSVLETKIFYYNYKIHV